MPDDAAVAWSDAVQHLRAIRELARLLETAEDPAVVHTLIEAEAERGIARMTDLERLLLERGDRE